MDDINQTYLLSVEESHRKAHGQYFTPDAVAEFMCRWVLNAADAPSDIFDPAVGLGVFLQAARKISSQVAVSGAEIDPTVRTFAQRVEPALFESVELADYLLKWGAKHNRIVCNPPYMRFQKFFNRAEVSDGFQRQLGVRLSGYTNSASAFLVKSLSELSVGGRLAYLLPLEFLNTGYGTIVKERLLEDGGLKLLIRFDDEKGVFPDAITTVGIVLVCKDGEADPVRFYNVESLEQLSHFAELPAAQTVSRSDLRADGKWLGHFNPKPPAVASANLVKSGFYGTFSRGIATGANEFFALSRERMSELGLSQCDVLPCLTKSSQVRSCIFAHQDFEELRQADARVFLLNAHKQETPSVHAYIRSGESAGYHERYLTKVRSPWYKLEKRSPAPILFGVFSRGRFKAIRNRSDAVNLTCFHGFYPNMFGLRYVDSLFLYFQSRAARRILSLNMRKYGDGLDKFEPNDLNDAMVPNPDWFDSRFKTMVKRALVHCEQHNQLPCEAEEAFDELVTDYSPGNGSNLVELQGA